MEGISNIRIVAVDAKRPPVIRKEPYIDIAFELSHQVPKNWSEDFNGLVSKKEFSASIRVDEGLYIETWVRSPDEIAANFDFLKRMVAECTAQYIAKIELSKGKQDTENEAANATLGEQGRLNAIVAGLDFSDPE
ncbi:MAG: hypothetical protein ACI9DC_005026 [Gammaproteobacteria bacterium]|jgi:hypothetical protein